MSNAIKHIQSETSIEKFSEIFGDKTKATAYLTTVASVVSNNGALKNADPVSVYMATITAATLNLPVNPNLGFAYIIPYAGEAQFQIGYKGFIQLAQRSGQFKTISATQVYEGQLVSSNPLTGNMFDWEAKTSDKIIGYVAYFELLNGFSKSLYMTQEAIKNHGKKYSKNFANKNSVWQLDFDAMAIKTVIKQLLSKYAPLSVEMQTAVTHDQAVINEDGTPSYPDAGSTIDAEELEKNLEGFTSIEPSDVK